MLSATYEWREVERMSKKQEAAVWLAVALVGGAVAHKVAAKQAATLGLPVLAVAAAGWALAQAIG
jgi:hypothetical protein